MTSAARLTRDERHPPDPVLLARWAPIVSHTHNLRVGQVPFAEAKRGLVRWCGMHGVAAVGLGSPWEPVSGASYGRYEGPDRDLYYSGRIDPESVLDREPIGRLFADLNRDAGGRTLFYIDNETPKCRYGHLWWYGWTYDRPAWHDYSQDRPICYYDGDPEREINPLTGEPHRRTPYLEVVAGQRRRGALAVWAHPTSWWTEGERFITNIAAELPLHLVADGRLDGLAVMGYDACHRGYQQLWFHLLDSGAVVPGFAETDSCFDRRDLLEDPKVLVTRMPVGPTATVPEIVACARAGRALATSGPFLHLTVDGRESGGAVATARDASHRVDIVAHPAPGGEAALGRVELIGRGGEVLAAVERFTGGTLSFAVGGSAGPAWLLARAFGERDDPSARQKEIRNCALTNPVYLRPAGAVDQAPATTDYRLEVRGDSPWLGGEIRFEDAAGEAIERGVVRPGAIARTLPASARVVLSRDGRRRAFAIAMENVAAQDLMRHLWGGGFRRDHAALRPGEVPAEEFRLGAMREALARAVYTV